MHTGKLKLLIQTATRHIGPITLPPDNSDNLRPFCQPVTASDRLFLGLLHVHKYRMLYRPFFPLLPMSSTNQSSTHSVTTLEENVFRHNSDS
jgi:hypothetical protein